MIDQIRIKNLRSIVDSKDINLKPITILLGANSTGKSTFLRSFPLFTQSVNKKLRGPISWFDAAYVDFGDFKTAKNKFAAPEDGIQFSYVATEVSYTRRYRYFREYLTCSKSQFNNSRFSFLVNNDAKGTFIKEIEINLTDVQYKIYVDDRNSFVNIMVNNERRDLTDKYKFNYNTSSSILPKIEPVKSDDSNFSGNIMSMLVTLLKRCCDRRLRHVEKLVKFLCFDQLNASAYLQYIKKGCGIKSFKNTVANWNLQTPEFLEIYQLFALVKLDCVMDVIDDELVSFYSGCDYIAPMRAEAERYYRIQGLQVQSVDASGHNLLEFVASLSNKEKQSYDKFMSSVLNVTVDAPSDSGLKSLHIKNENGDFSIADVGYGYSQVLPIITKLWHTVYRHQMADRSMHFNPFRPNVPTAVLIEQPELHLHPAMQAKVADTLIHTISTIRELKKGDVKLIIETHSSTIINRLGRRIREGLLDSQDVNILLFQKDEEKRNTIIKQINFNKGGQIDTWPFNFFDPED